MKNMLVSLGAALCLAGCSTVAISEKGSLAGVDVKGADGRADRTLCVGNEGCWLFNSLPILSSSMDWNAKKGGIDPYDLSLFKNETSVQRLTEAFFRYAERENCDVVDVVVDNRTTHPIGLFGISEWVGDILSTREVYVTGVLKERK